MELSESQTRALLINPLLANADWRLSDRTQVGLEIPVTGYDPQPWNGITDYCLYRPSGPALYDSCSGNRKKIKVIRSPGALIK